MNKALLAKVKEKTKDTRLSEKYLTAITEKLGGSVEDDSTDEELIETTATLIADVATESQGEATRWAQKAKGNAKTKTVKDDDTDDDDDNDTDDDTNTKKGKGGKGKGKGSDNSDDEIATLRKRLDEMEAERTRGARTAEINAAFEKHKIPVFLRERLGKTIAMMRILKRPWQLSNRTVSPMGLSPGPIRVQKQQATSRLMRPLMLCWNQ